ncbi:MAG TPA: hypothetical protein VN812_23890 [Candidatus Acidoferrales bacterium]|nr:hypothetical protein [Candidatus Acidoferrales bacterium]
MNDQPANNLTSPNEDASAPKQSDEDRRIAEYLYSDPLLSLIGFFDAGYKRRKPSTDSPSKCVALNDGRTFETVPTTKYGFPNTEDNDWLHGFESMLLAHMERRTDYTDDGALIRRPHLSLPIRFHLRELIRAAGKRENNHTVRSARAWLLRMTHTGIEGQIRYGKDNSRTVHGATHLFRQVVLIGEQLADGTAAAQVHVWPEQWFLSRLAYLQAQLLDHGLYQQLGRHAYAKGLLQHLYNGFYASSGKPWRKSYHDLCQLFGLTVFTKPARRAQQLDPGHRLLRHHGVIKSWAWSHGSTDAVLTFIPGPKYFEDLAARGDRRTQATRIAHKTTEPNTPPPALSSTSRSPRRTGNPYNLTAEQVAEAESMAEAVVEKIGHPSNRRYFFTLAAKAITGNYVTAFWKVLADTADARHRGLIQKSASAYFAAGLDAQANQLDLIHVKPPSSPAQPPDAPPAGATPAAQPQQTTPPAKPVEPKPTPEDRDRIRATLRDTIAKLGGKSAASETPTLPPPPDPTA